MIFRPVPESPAFVAELIDLRRQALVASLSSERHGIGSTAITAMWAGENDIGGGLTEKIKLQYIRNGAQVRPLTLLERVEHQEAGQNQGIAPDTDTFLYTHYRMRLEGGVRGTSITKSTHLWEHGGGPLRIVKTTWSMVVAHWGDLAEINGEDRNWIRKEMTRGASGVYTSILRVMKGARLRAANKRQRLMYNR